MTDEEIERRIAAMFDANYEQLKLDGGSSMTRESLDIARMQVIMYWRKLRDVAHNVAKTEVKLTLPEQSTPDGRRFTIEGVVDIVQSGERTVMYDIKTHSPDQVRGNQAQYAAQLNIYAHIWETLRGETLDAQYIICTQLPADLRDAARSRDQAPQRYERLLERWNPLIEIDADAMNVDRTIQEFGAVVDHIENGDFAPPPPSRLSEPAPGGRMAFARDICRNCDVRFSCSAYRAYLQSNARPGQFDAQFRQELQDYGDDDARMLHRLSDDDTA